MRIDDNCSIDTTPLIRCRENSGQLQRTSRLRIGPHERPMTHAGNNQQSDLKWESVTAVRDAARCTNWLGGVTASEIYMRQLVPPCSRKSAAGGIFGSLASSNGVPPTELAGV
jgi:hypothetical protein